MAVWVISNHFFAWVACNIADKKTITDMKGTHAFENILSVIIWKECSDNGSWVTRLSMELTIHWPLRFSLWQKSYHSRYRERSPDGFLYNFVSLAGIASRCKKRSILLVSFCLLRYRSSITSGLAHKVITVASLATFKISRELSAIKPDWMPRFQGPVKS